MAIVALIQSLAGGRAKLAHQSCIIRVTARALNGFFRGKQCCIANRLYSIGRRNTIGF